MELAMRCFKTLCWSLLFSLWTLSLNTTFLAASEELPILGKDSKVRGIATRSARTTYGFHEASSRDSESRWRALNVGRRQQGPLLRRRRARKLLDGKDSKKRQGVILLFIMITLASLQTIATCCYCVLQLRRYLNQQFSDTIADEGSGSISDLSTCVSFSTAVFVIQPGGSISLAIEDQILET